MPVTTLEELREHLQWALELEHATLPPYLCALYSIKPGTNQAAVGVITSVFIEEMLHMTLVANVLNAVGGTPVLDKPDFIPRYPTFLPHSANAKQASARGVRARRVVVMGLLEGCARDRPRPAGGPSPGRASLRV